MNSIVHSARLLKRRLQLRLALACVPRAAARPKRKRPPKRPKPKPKRKPKPKPKPKRAPKRSKRSEAAKKGWIKRRKRQRLIAAMHDAKWRHVQQEQPIGWTERRAELREVRGELWREISVEYSDDQYERERLAALEELEIDLLTADELYDYLAWMSEEFDIDISDLYRMYLGYDKGEM